jgi:hypothetical protein
MDYCTPYAWPLFYGNTFTDAMIDWDSQTDPWRYYSASCDPHTDIGGYLNSSPEIVLDASLRGGLHVHYSALRLGKHRV